MPALIILHNPRCSKSREALQWLTSEGLEPQVVDVTRTIPDAGLIHRVIQGLEQPVTSLVRRDQRFDEAGLTDADVATADQVEAVLLKDPALMERPIVMVGSRCLIGRPPRDVVPWVKAQFSR